MTAEKSNFFDAPLASTAPTSESSDNNAGRLAIATHLLHGWVWETDSEYRFIYLSDSVLTYTSRSPEWHYGRTRQELENYYIDEQKLEKLQQQLVNREPFGPFEYSRSSGESTYWVRSYGTPRFDGNGEFFGYRGVAQDVSLEMSARQAEAKTLEELEMSECVLRGTLECFPNAISVFNNDRQLVFANAHYYSLLNLPQSQLHIGTKFEDIIRFLADRNEVYGDDADDAIAKQLAIVSKGEVNRYQRTRPNGVRIEVVITPLPCGGFIKTYSDVTCSLELKARLDRTTRELAFERARREGYEIELERINRSQRS